MATTYEQLTVADVVKTFTAANASGEGALAPTKAIVWCGANPIRFTLDGTTPSATVGAQVAAGEYLVIYGNDNITNFKAIREGASNATLEVHYFVGLGYEVMS